MEILKKPGFNPLSGEESKNVFSLIPYKGKVSYMSVDMENKCEDELRKSQVRGVSETPSNLIYRISIRDIIIPDVLKKLYDPNSKQDKIKELAESILEYGQKEPIIVMDCGGQTFLIDGWLRLLAIKHLKINEVFAIYSSFDPDKGIDLEDHILQHHIRKDLSACEKLNEIKLILRVDEQNPNPNRDMDRRRKLVSLKLGNKFERSNVIELEKILKFERENQFNLKLAEKIISGQLKVSEVKSLIGLIQENEYTTSMENESKIISKYLTGEYDIKETDKLINSKSCKDKKDNKYRPSFPQSTNRYEIRQGNILNVDLSDVTFDVIFSSPPYFNMRKYGEDENEEIGNEKTREEYIKHIVDAFEKGWEHLNEKGSLFVNINDSYRKGFSLNIIESFVVEMENRGMKKVDVIFWEKDGAKPSNNNIHRLYSKTEYIIHFAKSKEYVWNPIGKLKQDLTVTKSCNEVGSKKKSYVVPNKYSILSNVLRGNSMNDIDDYLFFSNIIRTNNHENRRSFEKNEEKHTATFSDVLPLIPLLLTCPRDHEAIVGDIFAGTSSTGEVALALGHKYVGIELYKENVETSSRVLYNAEKEYQDSLYNNLFETTITEHAIAA